MSGAWSESDEAAALEFSILYSEDRRRGVVRPCEDYQRLFPGHEARVADEFVRLRRDGGVEPATSRDAGEETTRDHAEPPAGRGGPSFATGEPGERLGPYRILRELGRGGQGAVFLAEDERARREVALKVLTHHGRLSPAALERFRREATIASKLDHAGICPVYEIGVERGTPYLAMKALRGDTLARKISTARDRSPRDSAAGDGSLHIVLDETGFETAGASSASSGSTKTGATATANESPQPKTQAEIVRVLRLVEQTARALHAAHEAGVVHRDVKPGNIIVTEDGEPVVLDFGLAQDSDGDSPTLTRTGDLMGTPAYMSPEQIAAQRIRLDRRTDVYSLGVTLYECLTLRRPFEAPTREGLYQAILTKDPPDVRRLNPALSDEVRVVVETALEKDRDRRYATALDFAEELRRLRFHEPIAAKPIGPLTKLARFARRNPALAASLLGLFLALSGGLTTALHLLDKRDDALREKSDALRDKSNALWETTVERNAKARALHQAEAERNEKAAALDDYERLGDASRLARLLAEAETFWPADAAKIPAMRWWLDEAGNLEQNLAGHRAVRDALRRGATVSAPAPDAAASRESRPAEPPSYRFATEAAQFKHDTMAKLVEDLERFLDPDPFVGAVASVKKRLAFALVAEESTRTTHAERWAAARAAIADPARCPQYAGLRIAPQFGLAPIRQDPASGLWEFAHLQTTADGVDPIPALRPDGSYDLQESTGLIFVLLPGGVLQMGARPPTEDEREAAEDGAAPTPNVDPAALPREAPIHAVTLAPFFVAKYEMTQAQWRRLAGRNPSHYRPGAALAGAAPTLMHPVEQISWEDCAGERGWIVRLGLELPTEAQWEYAARAQTTTPWWPGVRKESLAAAGNLADQFCKKSGGPASWTYEAWDDGHLVHAPIGRFAANRFGLHDTLGNVSEWCRDVYANYAPDNIRPGDGLRTLNVPTALRALRGGGFSESAAFARSAARGSNPSEARNGNIGVRPARRLVAP